ncbi:MAG: pyridoxamine 5'-phosphate oxidase family protein [Chloroflexota bacterium]
MTDRPLPDRIRTFLGDERYATISTIDPDGSPRQAVIWYTLDGDEMVLNSAVGRRWPSNLLRDPRLGLSVIDALDGLRWVGLTGTVRPITDPETTQADIAGMARRYEGADPDEVARSIARFEAQDRISFRFRPESVHDHLDE